MYVLQRTMDHNLPHNDINEISDELPGFGWMYEAGSASNTETSRSNKSEKSEKKPSTEEALSSQSSPRENNEPATEPGPYNTGSAPTTLAYVDVNNRMHWPIPPTSGISGASFSDPPSRGHLYNNLAPFTSPLQADASSQITSQLYMPSSSFNTYPEHNRDPGLQPSASSSSQEHQPIPPPVASHSGNSSLYATDASTQSAGFIGPAMELDPNWQDAPKPARTLDRSRGNTDRGRPPQGSTAKPSQVKRCPICSKRLRRDLTRHMRIHDAVSDFACPFPREKCAHKHGQFNRPYEYKKHLMSYHFKFDDPAAAKTAANLNEKLKLSGRCQCGDAFENVGDWINGHVGKKQCSLLEPKT